MSVKAGLVDIIFIDTTALLSKHEEKWSKMPGAHLLMHWHHLAPDFVSGLRDAGICMILEIEPGRAVFVPWFKADLLALEHICWKLQSKMPSNFSSRGVCLSPLLFQLLLPNLLHALLLLIWSSLLQFVLFRWRCSPGACSAIKGVEAMPETTASVTGRYMRWWWICRTNPCLSTWNTDPCHARFMQCQIYAALWAGTHPGTCCLENKGVAVHHPLCFAPSP